MSPKELQILFSSGRCDVKIKLIQLFSDPLMNEQLVLPPTLHPQWSFENENSCTALHSDRWGSTRLPWTRKGALQSNPSLIRVPDVSVTLWLSSWQIMHNYNKRLRSCDCSCVIAGDLTGLSALQKENVSHLYLQSRRPDSPLMAGDRNYRTPETR